MTTRTADRTAGAFFAIAGAIVALVLAREKRGPAAAAEPATEAA